MIKMIWAEDKNRGIGVNGKLPWHLPSDLKHFKEVTMGNLVIMGRKTFESIGKPLPGRINVILTRDPEPTWVPQGCWVYDNHISLLNDIGNRNAFVIGGREIFNKFMPFATKLYITHIQHEFDVDTYAPSIPDSFKVVDIVNVDDIYSHKFVTYERLF